jgi:hypothetical protein
MDFPFVTPEWLCSVNKNDIECYLTFLRNLSPQEQRVYISYRVLTVPSGNLASIIGATDTRIKKIGLCGEPKPVIVPSSKVVEELCHAIWERWKKIVIVYVGEKGGDKGAFSVETATIALFLDTLFNIKVEAELDVDMIEQRRQVGYIMLDSGTRDSCAKRWLDEHDLPLKGPLPEKLTTFEQKMGGWFDRGRFIECKKLRRTA